MEATRIAVDPKGNPWVIQDSGEIFHYENGKFKRMPGKGRDISVGSEGTVYSIGIIKKKKGYQLYKWSGSSWSTTSGYGKRVAVDNDGKPWVVTKKHRVYKQETNFSWTKIKGSLDDIAIGPEGSIIGVR